MPENIGRAFTQVMKNLGRLARPLLDTAVQEAGREGLYTREVVHPLYEVKANKLYNAWYDIGKDFMTPKYRGAKKDLEAVKTYRYYLRHTGVQGNLTPRQRYLDSQLDTYLLGQLHEQRMRGPLINGVDEPQPVEGYIPEAKDQKVRKILTGGDSPEKEKLIRDYTAHYLLVKPNASQKQARAAALQEIDLMRESHNGIGYAPLTRPHGVGLPLSWQAPLDQALMRHNMRWANAMAFHEVIQSDPIAARIFDLPDNGRGEMHPKKVLFDRATMDEFNSGDEVRPVVRDVTSMRDYYEWLDVARQANQSDIIEKLAGFTTAGRLGIKSAVRDIGSSSSHVFEVAGAKDAKTVMKNAVKATLDYSGMFDKGVMRKVRPLDFYTPESVGAWITNAAQFLREVQGRNAIELLARRWLSYTGEEMTKLAYAKGDAKYLDKWVGPLWKELPVEDASVLGGKRFMESFQGSYGPQGLPSYLLRSSHGKGVGKDIVRANLSLARWNIERANNFYKNVVQPAKEGNFLPLLRATSMGILSASAINEVNKVAFGVEPRDSSLGELFQSGGEDLEYSIVSKLALVGYGGVLSDLAKAFVQARAGEAAMGYEYPAFILFDEFGRRVSQFANAVKNGDVTGFHLLTDFPIQLILDNIQSLRLAKNYGKQGQPGAREHRIYRRIIGGQSLEPDVAANPFSAVTKLSRAQSPGEIESALRKITPRVVASGRIPNLGGPPSSSSADVLKPGFEETLARIKGPEGAREILAKQQAARMLREQKLQALREIRDRAILQQSLPNVPQF